MKFYPSAQRECEPGTRSQHFEALRYCAGEPIFFKYIITDVSKLALTDVCIKLIGCTVRITEVKTVLQLAFTIQMDLNQCNHTSQDTINRKFRHVTCKCSLLF